MNIESWLAATTDKLAAAGVATARLDALVLLEDTLSKERASLLAHPETVLTHEQLTLLSASIERRSKHIPLAYIRGKAEFYGREFAVNEHVLVPRPESEAMIALVKASASTDSCIVDIGTGSGALTVTTALETGARIIATDIDERCLALAQLNASTYSVKLQCYQGSVLEPLLARQHVQKPDILLANLPYVPDDYQINQAAAHEPTLALFGGIDGLDLYRELFSQLLVFSKPARLVIVESLEQQHDNMSKLARQHGYRLAKTDGLAQAFMPQ